MCICLFRNRRTVCSSRQICLSVSQLSAVGVPSLHVMVYLQQALARCLSLSLLFSLCVIGSHYHCSAHWHWLAASHYHCTITKPQEIRYTHHTVQGWRSVVNYCNYSQKKKLMKTKMQRTTRSCVYATENRVLAMSKEFQRYVRDVIRGGRPSRSHSLTHPFFLFPHTITQNIQQLH